MPEELEIHREEPKSKRMSLAERMARLEQVHVQQGELLAQALGEIRRLRACVAKVRAKRNGAAQKGSC